MATIEYHESANARNNAQATKIADLKAALTCAKGLLTTSEDANNCLQNKNDLQAQEIEHLKRQLETAKFEIELTKYDLDARINSELDLRKRRRENL